MTYPPTDRTELDAAWTVTLSKPGEGAPPNLADTPIPAQVPGVVHLDLLREGHIADPYVGLNEHDLHWIGLSTWVYEGRFDWRPSAGRRVHLVFTGVDTVASIRLNGHLLGDVANMHRTHRYDVTDHLETGANLLAVEFASPVAMAESHADEFGPLPHTNHHPYNQIRKMACNFGWDWGPDVVTVGLWRPVILESWNTARLDTVRPHVTVWPDGRGVVDVDIHLEREVRSGGPLTATVAVGDSSVEVPIPRDDVHVRTRIDAGIVERWWPHSLGEQPLYPLDVELRDDTGVLDTWSRRIGFRTIGIDETADSAGTSWQMVVNDTPLWSRGVNWIPEDAFPTRVGADDYRARLQQAVDANVDVVRVWGGGIYEADAFYEACDELGLLVWQDFLFTCAAYPERPAYAGEIEAEARDNVARLMAHPSLALWNGNNENLWGYEDWGWKPQLDGQPWGRGYYDHLLPRIVGELDPLRPYIPGSPHSPEDHHPNDPSHGIMHIWDVWNTDDYRHYRSYRPRFVSEFGYQGPPTHATLREALPQSPIDIASEALANHQKATDGMTKLARGLQNHFRVPADLATWHFLGQINQARAVSLGIEWFRSLPENAGAIVWQLNDCWPVISWAAVDGSGRRKPLWYALRRSFADRLVTIQPDGTDLSLVLHNLGGDEWTTDVHLRRVDVSGEVLAEEALPLSAAGNEIASTRIPTDLAEPASSTDELLVADVDGLRSVWAWEPDNRIRYREGAVAAELTPTATGLAIDLTATALVRDLCLFPDRIHPEASVDDMLLTLLPGERTRIEVTGVDPSAADLLVSPPVLRFVNQAGVMG